jgi:mRNA interferase HigB
MHVISRKALRTFREKHADSEQSLRRWHTLMTTTNFESFAQLRLAFPSADMVGDLTVFNIAATDIV